MEGFQKVECWDFGHKRNKVAGQSTSAEKEPAAPNDKSQRRSDYLIDWKLKIFYDMLFTFIAIFILFYRLKSYSLSHINLFKMHENSLFYLGNIWKKTHRNSANDFCL
jgi:hypothetical protein